jgi:hypothetical protein
MLALSFEFLPKPLRHGHDSRALIDLSCQVHYAVECTGASFASTRSAVAECGGFIESGVAGAGELVNQSRVHES